MRTSIVIDDDLFRAAQEATALKTKRAVVEAGLRLLVRSSHQADVLEVPTGIDDWEGDLRQMRKER